MPSLILTIGLGDVVNNDRTTQLWMGGENSTEKDIAL